MTIEDPKTEPEAPNHWQLARDVLVFQAKLALDGLRDLLLLPISLGAAFAGLLLSPDNPGKYFNRLLKFGRQSDVWINLFSASQHYRSDDEKLPSSDAYVQKLEDMLVQEYKKGGVVKNLKDHTDQLVEKIQSEMAKELKDQRRSQQDSSG